MTDLPAAAHRLHTNPHTAGDAVRLAMVRELLTMAAATLRFVLLDPRTWVAQRYTEPERDMLRMVVERVETAAVRDLLIKCPLCGGHTCEDGCPLESVRLLAEADGALADATPDTEANRQ